MTQSLIQIYSISTSKIELSKGHMLVRKVAKRCSLLNDLKHEGIAAQHRLARSETLASAS